MIVLLSLVGGCALSGVFPPFSAEVLLLSTAALTPGFLAVPLIVAGSVGMMIGRSIVFLSARAGEARLTPKRASRVTRVLERLRSRPRWNNALVLTSAAVGLPPFYPTSIAAGVLRVPYVLYLLLGFVGTLVRFTLVVLIPHLFRGTL